MRSPRKFALFLLVTFLMSFMISSCKLFRGDPRKNCNHPKHGEYMREKMVKKRGF